MLVDFLNNQAESVPIVSVVGHVSRSSYEDLDTILIVLEILKQRTSCALLNGAHLGFDYHLIQLAEEVGLEIETIRPTTKKDGSEKRSLEVIDGSCLLLAFPQEVFGKRKRSPITTADESIVMAGASRGLPILGVYRDAATKWFRSEA